MSNCMLGFPNRADEAVLSGGAWTVGLPLAMLQNRVMGKVARTTNTALASAKINMDMGRNQKIQLVALRAHNFSLEAKYRVTASLTADFAVLAYDSGWCDVWPVVYPFGSLEWEDPNWWGGKYTVEETEGYVTELDHILPAARNARYWRIELDDQLNAAGYLQAGRLFIGPAWQPVLNMSYGAGLGWETKTAVQEAIGGAEYFQRRTPYRVAKFSIDWMTQDEAFGKAFELMRRAGIDQEVLFVHNPADTIHALRRRYIGRLRALNAIEYPYFNVNKTAFEVKELI